MTLDGVHFQLHAFGVLVGDSSLLAICTCADWLLALPADSVTGIWFGGSAISFHCSYNDGVLLYLAYLLLVLGSHLLEQCWVGAVSVDGVGDGGAGGKIAEDGLGPARCLERSDLLFQGCCVLQHSIVYVGGCCCWCDGWYCWAALVDGICAFLPTLLSFMVGSSRDDAIFLCEGIPGCRPRLIA